MSKYDRLKKQSDATFAAIEIEVNSREAIADEIHRVSQVSLHAGDIISELDNQFSKATKLDSKDITFLFLATALQCIRQYVLSNEKFRIDSNQGDKLMSKITPKNWKDILLCNVPYDATRLSPGFKDLVESIGISGKTHRYRTLGHDPILGWIFGPMNILSDSLTKSDICSTYLVENSYITGFFPLGTIGAFQCATKQINLDNLNLPAAVAKQALHFGSDYFTKQGLPIPFLSTINNDLSKDFLMKYHIDMWSIMRGTSLSILINNLIACIHRLFYDERTDGNSSNYEVRTKKILCYSNVMASTSNIIYTALSKDLTKLDVGGILVTIYRVINDYQFIQNIKYEFIEQQWNQLVLGNDNSSFGRM